MTNAAATQDRSASLSEEIRYVLDSFDVHFSAWRGSRIALHGMRDYAAAIIDAFDDAYRFCAVAVADDPGAETFYGKEVWSDGRLLEERPDLVILTERVRHAEAAARSLADACRQAGIAVFDMYGLDWLALLTELDAQRSLTLESWLALATPYDVVSFEVPDCLMMRNPLDEGAPLVCNPRMRQLTDALTGQGKDLVFIGRGPFGADEQLASLKASGLIRSDEDPARRFFMRAGEDGAWRSIRAAYPTERILHIGYGIPKEGVLPRYYGAATYRMVDGIKKPDFGQAHYDTHISTALDPRRLAARIDEAVEEADLVSFDVFDTLLTRTTLNPHDVFELVEEKALALGMGARGFARARLAAQSDLRNYDSTRIYRALQTALGISDADRDRLYELELEVERETLVARKPLCALLDACVTAGKPVVLVSDMYHSAATIDGLLASNGVSGYGRIFVSSEHDSLKCQGLFETVAAMVQPPSRILHIGNSLFDDVKQAEALGMSAVLVPSALDLALACGLGRSLRPQMTLSERCETGRAFAAQFEDPFEERPVGVLAATDAAVPHVSAASLPFIERGAVHVAPYDEALATPLRRGVLEWFPFKDGGRALLLASDLEALLPVLEKHFAAVDTAFMPDARYDCIVALDVVEDHARLASLLARMRGSLAEGGTALVGFRNRFGVKYLTGAVDACVKLPFDTLNEGGAGTRGRAEMERLLESAGFGSVEAYCIMPDAAFAQAVYTDGHIPAEGIRDRVIPYDSSGSPLVASEHDLYGALADEGLLPQLGNYFLMACRPTEGDSATPKVVHATLSLDRGPERATVTALMSDDTVLKQAPYPEGAAALEKLHANGAALQARGIATVPTRLDESGLHMPLVHGRSLMAHLDALLPDDPYAFRAVFAQLERDILQSSEHADISEQEARGTWNANAAELGTILATGYVDMVPANAFWDDGAIRYFDQEFTLPRCPASYILFRAVRYTWTNLPHLEQTIPLERMKDELGLAPLWDRFAEYDEAFLARVRDWDSFRSRLVAPVTDRAAMAARRRALAAAAVPGPDDADKPYGVGLLMGVFDLFHVGHLRLINRAKERCRFLRVAVLDDALVRRLKGITPTIPLGQRMEVLAAVGGVDEVVAVYDDPSRVAEWQRRPFDCFFSGDDYSGDPGWELERLELRGLGADIEFFPYTVEQSSSAIRAALGPQPGKV